MIESHPSDYETLGKHSVASKDTYVDEIVL